MNMIKDLGMFDTDWIRKDNGKVRRMRKGLYCCPVCDMEVSMFVRNGNQAKTCRKCVKVTHGASNTRLFKIWGGMKHRVKNQPDSYVDINMSLYDKWNDFSIFQTWAVENGYKDGLSIDRIDNNIGYSPSNCRWTTVSVQQNNKREIQANNTSGIKGVSKQGNKWRAGKTINKKSVCFGLYDTIEDAKESYTRNTECI